MFVGGLIVAFEFARSASEGTRAVKDMPDASLTTEAGSASGFASSHACGFVAETSCEQLLVIAGAASFAGSRLKRLCEAGAPSLGIQYVGKRDAFGVHKFNAVDAREPGAMLHLRVVDVEDAGRPPAHVGVPVDHLRMSPGTDVVDRPPVAKRRV